MTLTELTMKANERILHFGVSTRLSTDLMIINTVKPVLSGHSNMNKIKVLKIGGSLLENNGAFCNPFDLH